MDQEFEDILVIRRIDDEITSIEFKSSEHIEPIAAALAGLFVKYPKLGIETMAMFLNPEFASRFEEASVNASAFEDILKIKNKPDGNDNSDSR